MFDLRRRRFITLLGGAAAAWPLAARAQNGGRVRRIGVLMAYPVNDPQAQARNAPFVQGLQQFGWTVGNNVAIDYRWSVGNEDDTRKYAAELVAVGQCSGRTAAARDTHRANRVRAGSRSSRGGVRRQFGASGWEHHWVYSL